MRILLIRHGATDQLGHVLYGRLPGVHINSEGHRQAQSLADALKKSYRIDEVVSSPLERTLETAQCVAAAQELSVTVDEGINELDFGSWLGKAFSEIADDRQWKKYNEFRSIYCPPGGEFITEVQARGWRVVEKVLARHTHESTAAIVTHGDVIRALLLLLLGMPLDHIHRLEASPASMSEVLLGSGPPRVVRINQIFYSS